MAFLNEDEMAQVKRMKEAGMLQLFKKEDVAGITKNGGVSIFCGDGDIDARSYHKKTVTSRVHSIMVFGGPLVFAPSFREYDKKFAEGLMRNIRWGMEAKHTLSVFLCLHWPCGVGAKFDYNMTDVINMAPEIEHVFLGLVKKIYTFFHVKKIFADKREEQNTYKLIFSGKEGM